METGFYIILNIKTGTGFEKYGKFFIGEDAAIANNIFNSLKGQEEADDNNLLQIDFMEMKDNLPQNVRLLSCTLDEMTENFRIITKEIFKRFNLKS
ncbi:MAG: hypothetical protein EOO01_01480 [Chitinophagaceae bacterium]|nr:MAG: hypothetical protein EOO01_01480 [Chitinophagaceae bacterium]